MKTIHYILYVTDNILKGEFDNIISEVNNHLKDDNFRLQYESIGSDKKYFISFESRINNKYYLALRPSQHQFKNPHYILNNGICWTDQPDNYELISVRDGNKQSGMNLFINSNFEDIDKYIKILNLELNKYGAAIKKRMRTI